MANTFTNAGVAIQATGAPITLYQVPIGQDAAVVHSIFISNIDGANSANVDIEVSTNGAGGTFFYVGKTLPVPADSTLVLDKPINLRNADPTSLGDMIRCTASADGDLDGFCSVLEIT
jgi:hypothetical protein